MASDLLRYADTLSYDRDRGVVGAHDGAAFVELGDPEAVAGGLEAALAGRWAGAFLATYGLALAARAWAGRPSEARRGAIIQAAERLRAAQPADLRLARLVEQALARADAAILAGGDAEAAVVSFVEEQIARADRVAERVGKLAAGLLDERDGVLVHGDAGLALGWALFFARQEGKQPRLFRPADPIDDQALGAALAEGAIDIFFTAAERIALDGGVLAAPGAEQSAGLARRHGLPRYVLGYDGPDPSCPAAADLAGTPAQEADVIAPGLISAIITTRGIYRPEMIARYLGDGEPPLDVIPLSLN